MARVLVTDGEERAALAVVRSLGRAGHELLVCSPRRRSLAGASRFAARVAPVPDPLRLPDAFAEAVAGLCRDQGMDVLLPISEASLMALLPHRAELGSALPFPELGTFERVRDKEAVLATARSLGIGVPAQRIAPASGQAPSPAELAFPVVLKPARSVIQNGAGRTKSSVVHAADAAAYERALERMPAGAYPLLVQQRIEGPGAGVFVLVWEGELLAAFGHRRLREKPPTGGVSVYRESVALDGGLLELSLSLLRRLGWEGVAMVEYKLDQLSRTPYLMEINGRFWGSLQLAIDAGVDFPALLVAAALGRKPRPVSEYRSGVRTRWWWGDVDHLIARARSGDHPLRALGDFLHAPLEGARNEVLQWRDPLPAWRETLDWLRRR